METPRTLAALSERLAESADAPALIALGGGGPVTWSYADLARDIGRLAAGLVHAGVQPREPILLFAPNSPAWVVSYFAIVRAGALAVPVDDAVSDAELARVVAVCGARRAFTTRRHVATFDSLAPATRPDLVLLDDEDWRSLLAEGTAPLPQIAPEDAASLLYTSGTTGMPKGVPLSHANFLANVDALAAARLVGPDDRILLPLPLHHAYPFTVGLLGTLAAGATLVLPAGISGPEITSAIRDTRATVLIGVPRLYSALLAAVDAGVARRPAAGRAAFRLMLRTAVGFRRALGWRVGKLLFRPLHREIGPSLRILASGGAHLDATLAWTLEGLGWRVLTGYGLTETAPMLTFSVPGRTRIGSAGVAVPDVDLRIDAPAGETTGEIQARGPSVFSGYRGMPAETGEAFTGDGWFRTGDLGHIDSDGFLYVTGRIKEVIVLPGGENVLPEDVEAAYTGDPFIREIAILEHDGALVALIVPDEETIRAHGAARADDLLRNAIENVSLRQPTHHRVAGFRLTRQALPRTQLGKLRRHLLPALYDAIGREAGRPAAELTAADAELLQSAAVAPFWTWLGARFPDQVLTLDTSPQLDLGMDSLEWVTLTLEIQQRFGFALTAEAIAQVVTLRDLVTEVLDAAARPAARTAVTAVGAVAAEDRRWLTPIGPLAKLLGAVVFALNRFVMRTAFRLRADGADRVPLHGPVVVTPNHSSYLDPSAVAAALPPRCLPNTYWAGWTGKMFAGPASRLLSRVTRVLPVDPNRRPADSLALGQAVLKRRHLLVWFPEGRRSLTGELGPFLPGVDLLLEGAGARAVPTLIRGTFAALPAHRRWPRLRTVTVTFGHPLSVAQLAAMGEGEEPAHRVASGLRRAVAALAED